MFSSLTLLFALSAATPAEAGVVVSFGLSGLHLTAWSPHYVPAPRSGWSWSAGHYDSHGQWHPGHWRPHTVRSGHDWVSGYWVGSRYYEGYWRPLARLGYAWTAGFYHAGHWNEGYWSGRHTERVYERHESRHEVREDRHEAREDRREVREDRHEVREDRHEARNDRKDRREDGRDRRKDRADSGVTKRSGTKR